MRQNPFERFDKIYCINIDKCIDRWVHFKQVAEEYGFYHLVKRWSATFHHNGGYGCSMSHKRILRDAKKNDYKNILIFEDDVKFIYDKGYVWNKINDVLSQNDNYDILYLGLSIMKNDRVGDEPTNNTIKVHKANGCFAIAHQHEGLYVYDDIPESIDDFEQSHRNDTHISGKLNLNKISTHPPLTIVRKVKSTTTKRLGDGGTSIVLNGYKNANLIDYDNVLIEKVN